MPKATIILYSMIIEIHLSVVFKVMIRIIIDNSVF